MSSNVNLFEKENSSLSTSDTLGGGMMSKYTDKVNKSGIGKLLLGGGLLIGGAIALPVIIGAALNVIALAAGGAVLLTIIWFLSNKNFRKILKRFGNRLIDKLNLSIIKADPIAVLRERIDEIYEKIGRLERSLIMVKKQLLSNERKVEAKKLEMEEHLNRAKVYRDMGRVNEATLELTNASFCKKMIENYLKRCQDTKSWVSILERLLEYSKFTAKKNESEISFRIEEYESIKTQHEAFSSFKSVVNASPEELKNFAAAVKVMEDDVDTRLAEMDYVLNTTGGLIGEMDVEKSMMSKEAQELLKRYEEVGLDGLFRNPNEQASSEINLDEIQKSIEGMQTNLHDLSNIKNNDAEPYYSMASNGREQEKVG